MLAHFAAPDIITDWRNGVCGSSRCCMLKAATSFSLRHEYAHTFSRSLFGLVCALQGSLDSSNMFQIITIMSFFILLPISLATESSAILQTIPVSSAALGTRELHA